MFMIRLAGAKDNYVIFSSVAANQQSDPLRVICALLAFATSLSIIYSFFYPLRHALRDCPCNVGMVFQPEENCDQEPHDFS